METTFYNVMITVSAPSAKKAYDRLCEALATRDGIEWHTDIYDTDDRSTKRDRPTYELFPKD